MKELDSFTVERLEGWLEVATKDGPWRNMEVCSGMLTDLLNIALAAKRAEPVAWTSQRALETRNKVVVFTDDMSAIDYAAENYWTDIVELYTTPQLNSLEIPEGWKLVPNMPTLGMLSVLGLSGSFESMLGRYADMLYAAPEKENG